MRLTIAHNRSVDQVKRSVDRSFDEIFRNPAGLPIQIVDEHRAWHDSVLHFSFDAKMGFLRTPIKGTVAVTDKDLTIEADLGLLNKLIPEGKASATIEERIKGLLS